MTAPARGDNSSQNIKQPVRESITIRQKSHKKEQRWRLERQTLIARFKQLQQAHKRLLNQKTRLLQELQRRRGRVAKKKKQLADIEQISYQLQPFLDQLVKKLRSLLSRDLPFLVSERRQRIQKLEELLVNPELSISEKTRRVMEALFVEAEYGLTTEVSRKTISISGQRVLVDLLRLGRLVLFYSSLDRKHCGFYNVATAKWQTVDASSKRAILKAIDITRKRHSAELVTLPLGRMIPR